MKVFGIRMFVRTASPRLKQVRCVVAVKSQRLASIRFGVSLHEMRNFGGETGNKTEIELAMTKPGTVFFHDEMGDGEWHELNPFGVKH